MMIMMIYRFYLIRYHKNNKGESEEKITYVHVFFSRLFFSLNPSLLNDNDDEIKSMEIFYETLTDDLVSRLIDNQG
jgi:hypothetical protein